MGESLLTTWMNARIRHILQISRYMKEDILQRHDKGKVFDKEDLSMQEDYSFGWQEVIEKAVINWASDCGYLFTGPDGCGKHTAAELTYYTLENNVGGFELVFLPAKALLFTPAEQKAFEEERSRAMERGMTDAFTEDITHYFFQCLFHQFPTTQRICLMFDNSDQLDMQPAYERLGEYLFITLYECQQAEPAFQNLFVIIIDKQEQNIPGLLHKKLMTMRMSYPTLSQRLALLQKICEDNNIAESLAEKTEHYTYAQLRNLAKNVQIYWNLLDRDKNFYDELAFSQTPLPTIAANPQQEGFALRPPVPYEEPHQLVEEKIRLYQRLTQFIENLPEILEQLASSMPVAVPQTTVVQEKAPAEEPASIQQLNMSTEDIMRQQQQEKAAIAEETANMPMGELLGSILGEDRMQRILAPQQ